MKILNEKAILQMHKQLVDTTGGEDGIRDIKLLKSAINSPFQTFDGKDLYPTLISKASRLAFSITRNHPFVDGNKRIGVLSMLVFLELNNVLLDYTDSELVELGIGISTGKLETEQISKWIIEHMK